MTIEMEGSGVSHLELILIADLIGDAARAEDRDRLHGTLCRLRNKLAEHVMLEGPAIEALTVGAAASVRLGHRRLLSVVDDMLLDADDAAGCACLVRAAELRGLLARQIRLEGALGSLRHRQTWDGPASP
jgi:hypothetical protein